MTALLAVVLSLCAFASPTRSQCATQWVSGSSIPGTNSWVNATTFWDPDGAGPATPRLVLGGYF
ncbi:MAG: hypothetical protein KDC98_10905 [Planctomycetes bacterium]|nr:hypothetical protein [Planctomycetota bacterium]